MFACVDVAYRDDSAIAGCLLFRTWSDACAVEQFLVSQGPAAPYRSGEFYLRELPPTLAVLSQVDVRIETVLVDGYVWLNSSRMGLGAHLHFALEGKIPVIGVAKNAWSGQPDQQANDLKHQALAVMRGKSKRPLFVTSVGIDVALAADHVREMHGPFRIPTLLATVDRLVRSTHTEPLLRRKIVTN
jgi:deoxyribonuclease V